MGRLRKRWDAEAGTRLIPSPCNKYDDKEKICDDITVEKIG
jgi:hypothetical protein